MVQHLLTIILNVGFAAAAVVIVVSLIRNRTADYRNIEKSEISADLSAADDLLDDVISERGRWEALQRSSESGGAAQGP